MGAGHGTSFFSSLVLPCFLIWPALGWLWPKLQSKRVSFFATALAILPLVIGFVMFFISSEARYIHRVWRGGQGLVLVYLAAFCIPSIVTLWLVWRHRV
jgi:hypothetical protein